MSAGWKGTCNCARRESRSVLKASLPRSGSYFRKASFNAGGVRGVDAPTTAGDADVEGFTLAKQVGLAPDQTAQVEIPMKDGSRAAVVFLAPPNVSATLRDSAGNVVGKNAAGTPESRQPFRTIAVERAVTNGVWKLKLESRGAAADVLLAAFCDPNPDTRPAAKAGKR